MGWFARRRLNHAAKLFAEKLPAALVEGWGGSEYYTPEQIRAAVTTSKLPLRYIAIAFAAYLPQDQYLAMADELPLPLPYDSAREAFFEHVPSHLTGDGFEPPPLRASGAL
jgi:hypothetical protein